MNLPQIDIEPKISQKTLKKALVKISLKDGDIIFTQGAMAEYLAKAICSLCNKMETKFPEIAVIPIPPLTSVEKLSETEMNKIGWYKK